MKTKKTSWKRNSVISLAILLLVTLLAANAYADPTLLDACGEISSSGVYQVTATITTSGTCFTISADDVELDCNSMGITGDGTESGVTFTGRNNITISDCTFESFYNGISAESGKNIHLSNVGSNSNSYNGFSISNCMNITMFQSFANSNSQSGIEIASSSGANLSGCEANSNGGSGLYFNYVTDSISSGFFASDNNDGIHLSSGSNNNLSDTTANSNYNGIYLDTNSNNNILSDATTSSNTNHGIYFDSSSNSNVLFNIVANSNTYDGIYLESSNNILSGINATSNKDRGIELSSSSTNVISDVTANSNTNYGIYIHSSSNNILSNITATSNKKGIYLDSSSNNAFSNVTAKLNTEHGLLIDYSPGTIVRDSTLNNTPLDLFVSASSASQCNMLFTNVMDADSKQIYYYNSSVNIQGWDNNVSEIILCNADNSVINGVKMSHTSKKNGIFLFMTDNTILKNINVTVSNYGIYISHSSNNDLSDIVTNSNSHGIYFYNVSSSTIFDATANSNTEQGIYLGYCSNNNLSYITTKSNKDGVFLSYISNSTLFNITANSNSHAGINWYNNTHTQLSDVNASLNRYGIYFVYGSNNNLSDITTNSNEYGIFTSSDTNNTISGVTANSNTNDGISFGSNKDTVSDVTVNSNTNNGISITGSSNIMSNITANSNTNNGIYLESGSDNMLSNVIVNSNQNGIYIIHSSHHTISGVTATSNRNGIVFYSSSNNTLNNMSIFNSSTNLNSITSQNDNSLFNNLAIGFNSSTGLITWKSIMLSNPVLNSNSIIANTSLVSINASKYPELNVTTNITLSTDDCSKGLLYKPGFPTSASEIIEYNKNATNARRISCANGMATWEVRSWSGYTTGDPRASLGPYLVTHNASETSNVTQTLSFQITTGVQCLDTDCGDVIATLDPEIVRHETKEYVRKMNMMNSKKTLFASFLVLSLLALSATAFIMARKHRNVKMLIAAMIILVPSFFALSYMTGVIGLYISTGTPGAISTEIGASPFYTTSANPQMCADMMLNDQCNSTWVVYATGDANTDYSFYTIYNGSGFGNETPRFNITITSAPAAPAAQPSTSGETHGRYVPSSSGAVNLSNILSKSSENGELEESTTEENKDAKVEIIEEKQRTNEDNAPVVQIKEKQKEPKHELQWENLLPVFDKNKAIKTVAGYFVIGLVFIALMMQIVTRHPRSKYQLSYEEIKTRITGKK